MKARMWRPTTFPWLILAACTSFGVDANPGAGALPSRDASSSDGATPDAGTAPCGGFTPCDDFEREDPEARFGWTLQPPFESVARIETGPALSPTRSLVVPLTGAGGVRGYLSRFFRATPRLRLAVGVRVNPEIAMTQLFSVSFGNGRFVFVQAVEGRLELVEQDIQTVPPFSHAVPAGPVGDESWSRYVLDVDVAAKRATLVRDGAEVAVNELDRDNAGIVEVRVGVTYTEDGNATTIRYDDVGLLAGP